MRIIAFIIVMAVVFLAWPHIFPPPPKEITPSPTATAMSQGDMDYYLQIFDYAMTTVKPGESYSWTSYTARGAFSASDTFQSKSGSICRKFSENIAIGPKQAQSSGVACKRQGRDGWCRLKESNAMTCAMEQSPDWMVVTPGVNGNLPSFAIGGAPNMNANIHTSVNGDVDINAPKRGYGIDPSTTVTGAAGSTAGPVSSALKNMFNNAFSK